MYLFLLRADLIVVGTQRVVFWLHGDSQIIGNTKFGFIFKNNMEILSSNIESNFPPVLCFTLFLHKLPESQGRYVIC